MNLSIRLACVGTFLLAVVGCGRGPESAFNGVPPPVQPALAQRVAAQAGPARQGFAALADRGELMAYPRLPVRHDGAYTWHRTDLSEAHALNAIADGSLRVTTPSGETLVVRYDQHIEHGSGDWTWIGHIPGQEGEQTILTFGAHAAFGSIAQPGKPPLRLTVRNGVSWLVETDPTKVAGIINAATRPQRPDYRIPPKNGVPDVTAPTSAPSMASAPAMASATASTSTTVDLVLGYTPAFASDNGGQSGAITRLNYLVDVTNSAYGNSQINARVRLVATVAVSYPDNTSNDTTLDQLTGYDSSSNTTTSPNSAFSALRAAREQYGADLVSMVRSFRDPENGGCGVGWLIGGGQQGISTSDSYYGYSVVSDGTDVGTDGHTYFCLDETLAHELGHNMGANHDVDAAKGTDGVLNPGDYGAYAYSFGYKNAASAFYTIMAYGDSGQHVYRVFSDPRSTFCGGAVCGSSQADNARTLTQTIPTVASFRSTVVPLSGGLARNDVNGDGKSDLLWYNPSPNRFAYWLMDAAAIVSGSPATSLAAGYVPIATGDFNADGYADVVWSDGHSLSMRLAQAGGGASWQVVGDYPATWKIAGVADIDGDGKDDLLWYNPTPNRFAYWRMSGSTITSVSATTSLAAGYVPIATGDFNGDGYGDVVWSNGQSLSMRQGLPAGGARWQVVGNYPVNWASAGAADIDGDGKSDLLWHNTSPNRFAYWLMSGAAISYASPATSLSTGYVPIATGDFNGDGYGDMVWSNGQSLSMRLALPNLGASWKVVGSYPAGWKPAASP